MIVWSMSSYWGDEGYGGHSRDRKIWEQQAKKLNESEAENFRKL